MLPVEGVGRVVCPAYLGGGRRETVWQWSKNKACVTSMCLLRWADTKKNGRLGCLAAQHVPISRVNRKFLLASLSRFPGPDTDPHQVNNNNNSKPDPGLAAPRRCPEIYQTTCLLLRGVALGGGRQREKQMLTQFLFEGATRLPAKHWPSPPHSLWSLKSTDMTSGEAGRAQIMVQANKGFSSAVCASFFWHLLGCRSLSLAEDTQWHHHTNSAVLNECRQMRLTGFGSTAHCCLS